MKTILKLIVASLCAFSAVTAYAGTAAGEDAARHYRSHPDYFDGKKVDVDCAFVTRINGGPQIEGIVFFVAHTVDKDNRTAGGDIIVAVLEDEAEKFMRRYGTTVDWNPGESRKVDTTRLRGVFHQLGNGRVYIDESGEAHDIILEHRATAERIIPAAGVGGRGKGPEGGHPQ